MQMIPFGQRKIRSLMVLVTVILIHLALDILYRPMAYSQNLSDFGLKDSFTQITAVIGISLIIVLFEKEKVTIGRSGQIFLTVVPVVAMLGYEFIQLLIPTQSFDTQDLIFTLLGGVFIWFIQSKIVN
jgi:hypothetical protein